MNFLASCRYFDQRQFEFWKTHLWIFKFTVHGRKKLSFRVQIIKKNCQWKLTIFLVVYNNSEFGFPKETNTRFWKSMTFYMRKAFGGIVLLDVNGLNKKISVRVQRHGYARPIANARLYPISASAQGFSSPVLPWTWPWGRSCLGAEPDCK